MSERTHSVRLRLEVDQLRKDAAEASKAIASIGASAQDVGRQSTAMNRLGDAARGFGRTAAAVGTVAAGSLAALAVQTFRTGIAYNTLEQASRAALTTLLGSVEAANEQMDRLREFASRSPFPRQVFIQAQQQLLAFGLAAERVIPTLSAIQDAVAAAGGGAVDIQEIVRVLAQVQSTGKVSAEVLNQLGARGVDAAALIGAAFGKSAGEIREEISAGTLDAQTFLTTLTDQMTATFGGAAEDVKNTFVGSTDRIKGALRDIGGALAEPFVDPMGGGAAVQWANDVADGLRAFESALRPAVDVLRGQATPGFEAASAALQRLAEILRDVDLVAVIDQVKEGGPAFAALGAGLATAGSAGVLAALGMGQFAGALNPVVLALTAAAATSPELRNELLELFASLLPLVPVLTDLTVAAGQLASPTLAALAAALGPVVDLVGLAAEGFAALPQPVQVTVAALVALMILGPRMMAFGQQLITPFRRFRDEMALQRALHNQIVGGYQRLGDEAVKQGPRLSTMGAAAATVGRGFSVMRRAGAGLFAAMGGPWGIALAVGAAALASWAGQQADAKARAEELLGTLDDQTGAITENTRSWVANELERQGMLQTAQTFGIALDDVVDAALGEEAALRRVEGAIDDLAGATDGYLVVVDENNNQTTVSADKLRELAAQIEETRAKKQRLQEATGEATEAEEEFTEAEQGAAAAVEGTTNALREQADEIRAQTDPMFALLQSLQKLDEAQRTYNAVLEDSESTQQDVEAALLELAEAALEVQGAAGDAAGMFDGQLNPAFRATLEAAGLTEAQINDVEEAFRRAAAEGDDFAKDYRANVHVSYTSSGLPPDFGGRGEAPAGGLSVARQRGGAVFGPPGPDKVRARLTSGEHVWTVREVEAAGGHEAVEAMRQAVLAGSRHAVSTPVGVPSGGGSSAAATVSAGGQFEGELYLDTGQFLGVVRGQIADHDRQLRRRVGAGAGAAR